jgi:antitoxin (DNA-binding transcriptional repressor) of toxin-antitoxin stability system
METIGVRELQQRASAALRRVEQGETLGITDRGRLVAVLAPPSIAGGIAALTAAGRIVGATSETSELPDPSVAPRAVSAVLDELRGDR